MRDADSSTRVITFIFVLAQDSNSLMSHLQQQEEFEKVTASLRQHHHFIDAISDGWVFINAVLAHFFFSTEFSKMLKIAFNEVFFLNRFDFTTVF